MGFPESNGGDGWEDTADEGKKWGFLKFSTSVAGVPVAARRTNISFPEGGAGTWWLKTVSFAPNERKKVRVQTVSPLGGSNEWAFNSALSYNFTGGNWKGVVSRSDLEIRLPRDGHWAAVGISYPRAGHAANVEAVRLPPARAGTVLRKTWRDWEAESAVNVGVKRVLPNWLVEPEQRIMLQPGVLEQMVTFKSGDASNVAAWVPAFVQGGVTMVSFDHLSGRARAVVARRQRAPQLERRHQTRDLGTRQQNAGVHGWIAPDARGQSQRCGVARRAAVAAGSLWNGRQGALRPARRERARVGSKGRCRCERAPVWHQQLTLPTNKSGGFSLQRELRDFSRLTLPPRAF